MLISSYNRAALGDVLITFVAEDTAAQVSEKRGDVVQIKDNQGQLLGYNFFNVTSSLGQLADGQVFLDRAQVDKLNALVHAAGFTDELVFDQEPKFVIGVVTEFKAHPDSDHLHITQVDLGGGHTEQIVCGAPNAALGQHVVAALPGAMMPDGKMIWPGALRGVDSYGMLCSARELALPNAPQERGILVLPDSIPAGTAFDFAKAAKFLATAQA
jgi:tRNA-binding protein